MTINHADITGVLERLLTNTGDSPEGLRQLSEPGAHPEAFNPDWYDLDQAATDIIGHVTGEPSAQSMTFEAFQDAHAEEHHFHWRILRDNFRTPEEI